MKAMEIWHPPTVAKRHWQENCLPPNGKPTRLSPRPRREDLMPLYDYVCQTCNAEFELLVRSSDIPTCPSCGGVDLRKQVAKIASEIKYPAIAKSWRRAAALSGDLSNFSQAERQTKKS
jgi:putative FmdB family regulatory protein